MSRIRKEDVLRLASAIQFDPELYAAAQQVTKSAGAFISSGTFARNFRLSDELLELQDAILILAEILQNEQYRNAGSEGLIGWKPSEDEDGSREK